MLRLSPNERGWNKVPPERVQGILDRYRRAPALSSQPSARFREEQQELAERRDQLLQEPAVDSFLRDYPDETGAVRAEILSRLGSTSTISNDGDVFAQEEKLLRSFRVSDAETLAKQWSRKNHYRGFLAENYDKSEIPLSSYDREAKRLRRTDSEDTVAFEKFKEGIVHDWELAREGSRSLRSELDKDHDRQVLEDMKSRITQFRAWAELLAPIRRYFAFAWDLSASSQHESVFDLFQKSEEILQQREQVKAIADRLGRLDDAESDHNRRMLKSFSKPRQLVINRAAKSSVVGIRESDDISAIISSEVVLLSSRRTEDLFFLKFAEKKLLTYDYQPEMRSRGIASQGRVKQESTGQRRGPIIIAVDTSGSMQGKWEEDAKALALAIVRIAFRQRRSVHVISFSVATDSIVLYPQKRGSLEKLIQFLLLSFHGGTMLANALNDGLKMLETPEFSKADMMFLTDGDAGIFTSHQVQAMNEARQQGVRFYSLLVGSSGNENLLKQFDYNWRYQEFRLSDVAINLGRYRWNKPISNRS